MKIPRKSSFRTATTEAVPSTSQMTYYVRINEKEVGPFTAEGLRRIRGFVLQTPTRRTGTATWGPAYQIVDLSAYFHNRSVAARPTPRIEHMARVLDAITPIANLPRPLTFPAPRRLRVFFTALFFACVLVVGTSWLEQLTQKIILYFALGH